MNKLVIVFPIFNGLDYTKKGLKYLFDSLNNKYINHIQIIIADDGSIDGSSAWIKKNYPDIILLKGNGNLWWSGGVNLCIEYALKLKDFNFILLWNNDIKPAIDYFSNLFNILSKIEDNTIICSKIYQLADPDILISAGGIFNPKSGQYSLIGYGEKDNEKFNSIKKVDWFGGMGTIIPKKIFKQIGLFDSKNFPQYHGDSDFALRAKKAGIKILFFPQLKIWNDKSSTGYSNDNSFKIFIHSLFSLKSNHNICKEFLFYRKHAESFFAYKYIIRHYWKHIGGFFKWKFLGIFGMKRKTIENAI